MLRSSGVKGRGSGKREARRWLWGLESSDSALLVPFSNRTRERREERFMRVSGWTGRISGALVERWGGEVGVVLRRLHGWESQMGAEKSLGIAAFIH